MDTRQGRAGLASEPQWFEVLFHNSPVPVALTDAEGNFLDVNPALVSLLGYTRDEILHRNALSLLMPEDIPLATEGLEKLKSGDIIEQPKKFRARRKDGSAVLMECRGIPVPRKKQSPAILNIARPVSALEELKERLRQVAPYIGSLIERLPVGLIIWDTDFKVQVWNPAAQKIFGFSEEEALGKHPYELIVPKEVQSNINEVWSRLLQGDMTAHSVNENITKDGKLIICRWTNTPLFGSDGKTIGVLSICEDITQARFAEAKIAKLYSLQSIIKCVNELLLTAREENEIYRGVCDLLAKYEPVRFVWIGIVEPESPEVKPVAWAGYEGGYLQNTRMTTTESELGEGPIGKAIKSGKPIICGDIGTDPAFAVWREEALRRGYASVIALPLRHEQEIIGALEVYSGSKYAFDEEETAFLTEVAGDIAVGIKSLRLEKQLQQNLKTLEKALNGAIAAVSRLLESRDPYTSGHQRRVAELSHAIAQELGLPESRCHGIYMAALIHDIGKIAVPMEILNKPGRLSEHEFNIIKMHPQVAFDVMKGLDFPWPVAEVALQHHERLDGSGYPQGLKGDAIILEAKILAVADVVEAMSSHRPYRPALGIEKALAEITSNKGKFYDPDIVDACLRVFEKGFAFRD